MKAPETKLQQSQYTTPPLSQRDDGIETDWGGVFYPATPGAPIDEWRPGFWDALVGYAAYIDPERLRDPEEVVSEGEASEARTAGTSAGARLHRSSDDEDFSSEHGYEPGFEGRSEFEHGEFDRWL